MAWLCANSPRFAWSVNNAPNTCLWVVPEGSQRLLCDPVDITFSVSLLGPASPEFFGTAGGTEAEQTTKAAECQSARNALFPSSVPSDTWSAEGLLHFGSKNLQSCLGCLAAETVKTVPVTLATTQLCTALFAGLGTRRFSGLWSQKLFFCGGKPKHEPLNLARKQARRGSAAVVQGSKSVYKKGSHLRNQPR